MASSEPGRGKPSADTDKSENPFIRFRRFTDAKVSTVLQGILGLPTAFSNGNDPKSRWADFDDDLRRREELRARQGALSESESRRFDEDEGQSRSKVIPPAAQDNSGERKIGMDDEGELHDIQLYSPVTKSLFAHFNRRSDDDNTEWKNPLSPSSGFAWDVLGMCWPGNVYKLFEDQICSNPLSMIQSMTFNTLDRTAKRPECRWFHSDQSALPYLLFSPYSPLALTFSPSPMPAPRNKFNMEHGDLVWCRAFEDLLLASSGMEMTPPRLLLESEESSAFSSRDFRISDVTSTLFHEKRLACNGMTWINSLQAHGLLQPHGIGLDRPPLSEVGLLLSLLSPLMDFSTGYSDSASNSSEEDSSAQTEEEMYNRFFGLTTAKPSESPKESEKNQSPFANVGSIFEGMEDETAAFQQVLKELKALEDRNLEPACSAKRVVEGFKSKTPSEPEEYLPNQKSAGTQTDMGSETTYANAYVSDPTKNGEVRGHGGKKNDRVVSTTTTTEQNILADGTKTTTVSVTKCFADGRSVVTETSHSETPRFENIRRPWQEHEDEEVERKAEEKDASEKGKSKGWFWN